MKKIVDIMSKANCVNFSKTNGSNSTIPVTFLKLSRTSMVELFYFTKIVKALKPLTIFSKKHYHRCSTEFYLLSMSDEGGWNFVCITFCVKTLFFNITAAKLSSISQILMKTKWQIHPYGDNVLNSTKMLNETNKIARQSINSIVA